MRLLLDTHAFIWWANDPQRLSPTALQVCQDPANALVLSVVSLWEMQIKMGAGKIDLRRPLPEILRSQQETNGLTILAIEASHALGLGGLPAIHKDPFDRMLVAQAIAEGLPIVSGDSMVRKYPATVIW